MNKNLIIAFAIISILASCGKPKLEWQGKIEVTDGVTIIHNPKKPLYKKDIFYPEEDLSIGEAKGENAYAFSTINGFDVDDEGRIYVIDNASAQVRVFEANGEHLRTFGGKGQGPGEMQMPIFIQVANHNEIIVQDYLAQKLMFFSLNGEYLRGELITRTRYPVFLVKIDSGRYAIGIEVMAPPPVGGKEIVKYDQNFNAMLRIASEEQENNPKRGEFSAVKESIYCDVSLDDNIVWGNSAKYELYILNPGGTLVRKIIKQHDYLPMAEAEKKIYKKEYEEIIKAGGKLNFPDHFPAFMDIFFDDKGQIWSKTYERVAGENNVFYFDVFDRDGKYIAKIPVKANLNQASVWRNGKLYTIETGEEGFNLVKRYSVQWKL